MSNRYAVMGNPIAHSLSPIIHQWFAEQMGLTLIYEKIQIDETRFEQHVREFFQQGGKGLNITLPCKQRAFAMSDEVSPRSAEAKAANTLWMHAGRLYADNTDGIGLLRDMSRYVDLTAKNVLVLGAGGAARGILGSLLAANPAQLTIWNRTVETARVLQQDFPQVAIGTLEALKPQDVVINATSASLDGLSVKLPATLMITKPFCYDLAYDKSQKTAFVAWASSLGCVAVDGLGMLIEQAAEAFFIWHGVAPDTALVKKRFDFIR